MSENHTPTTQEQPATPRASGPPNSNGNPPQQKRGPTVQQIYALPAPIRTFPLPTFYPNNPVSLLHVAYAWLSQVVRPPPAEPAVIHHGVWSAATSSVYIMDEKSIRALWEQGFYGKGNLSRSEPNWLKREQVRKGLQEVHVSEILTVQRREERAQAKWERARLEQEAIRQTRLDEARQVEARRLAAEAKKVAKVVPRSPLAAPVGPMELLALPNSSMESTSQVNLASLIQNGRLASSTLSNGPFVTDASLSGSALSNGDVGISLEMTNDNLPNGMTNDHNSSELAKASPSAVLSSDSSEPKALKRQKSVRFSPKVESTTFQLSDPPSPNHSLGVKLDRPEMANGAVKTGAYAAGFTSPATCHHDVPATEKQAIVNKEHLQLTPEETFFLTFGLGVLVVTDRDSGEKLSSMDLLTLFRQHSYFPPRDGPDDPDLQPDDSFLLHYAVYHHFRSLGWVPRAGIKFGVDWLLYTKGPVFDHAEFGLMVIPSYSDPWWKALGKQTSPKTWQWMHSIVRVLSHVMKSLVLVYVDIPPPSKFDDALEQGLTDALKLYKVREIMVKRWSSNRNR